MNEKTVIALIITGVWSAGYITAIFSRDFHPPLEVNAVMLIVAGYLFGSGIRKGK